MAELNTARQELSAKTKELEKTRTELNVTRRLLAPTVLSKLNASGHPPSIRQPPISQIFISDGKGGPGKLLQNCIGSVQGCFPGSEHRLYAGEEIDDFISRYYDKDVLACFRSLKPFAYKADLARLCILAAKGGWYIDVGITWVVPIVFPKSIRLFTMRDRNDYCKSSWACNNAIIYSQEKHPALIRGIELIVENYKSNYYGKTSLCPTGPNVWGKAVAAKCDPGETLFGDICELTPRHAVKNLAYVTEEGVIIAFAKPSQGGDGLVAFGE